MSANFNLDQIADALEVGEVPEGLAAAFRAIAEGKDALSALGLKRGPGQRSRATDISNSRRQRWFREAATKYFSSQSRLQQSLKLHEGLARYHDSGWLRGECDEIKCPAKRLGRLEEYFWRILKERDHVLRPSTIYQML